MTLRKSIVGLALEGLSKIHATLVTRVYNRHWRIPIRGSMATHYFLRSYSIPTWKTKIFRALPLESDEAFYDVGVNIGQTLLEFRSVYPQTSWIGFEPNPYCVFYVEELIAANELEHCKLHSFGLSDRSDAFELDLRSSNPANSGATFGKIQSSDNRSLHVAALSLDSVSNSLAKPGIIKIDIEGHETYALNGMVKTLSHSRPFILIELLLPDRNTLDPFSIYERNDAVLDMLRAMSYRVFLIHKASEHDQDPTLQEINNAPRFFYEDRPELCDYLMVPNEKAKGIDCLVNGRQQPDC